MNYTEDDLKIFVDDMKERNIIYEEHTILKLRNYYGLSVCEKHIKQTTN